MKNFRYFATLFSLISFLCFLHLAKATVYGDSDDRHEVFQAPQDTQILAQSVPARILKTYLNYTGDINTTYTVAGPELRSGHCSSIRFAEQILGGPHVCTGFLIKEDILVTAGHCFRDPENDCKDYAWVFDYALKGAGDRSYTSVSGKNIYSCKRVVSRKYEGFGAIDYTVIQLDRPVVGRVPLKMDLGKVLAKNLPVFIIGYPSGLPQKVADNSTIISDPGPQNFETDTDAFQGNSGSPVFDGTTGYVIGIVSSGQNDYFNNGTCKDVRVCRDGDKCIMSKMSNVKNMIGDPNLAGIL